jgi:hypothetical protein
MSKEILLVIFNFKKEYFRKNYPDIRQQNKLFNEKLEKLNEKIDKKTKDRTMILSNLRRAVVLVTESLKVGEEKDENALIPTGQFITGNLFNQLYEILTSTEEIDLDEQQQQPPDVDINRSTLNVR